MALSLHDCYAYLSHGLYSGSTREGDIGFTAAERMTRIISFGLLEDAPTPIAVIGGVASIILGKIKNLFVDKDIYI